VIDAKSPKTLTSLRELQIRLDVHARDINAICAALTFQLKHVADIQADLDAIFAARDRRREALHVRPAQRSNGETGDSENPPR
jgi:hypothetical protein